MAIIKKYKMIRSSTDTEFYHFSQEAKSNIEILEKIRSSIPGLKYSITVSPNSLMCTSMYEFDSEDSRDAFNKEFSKKLPKFIEEWKAYMEKNNHRLYTIDG